MPALSLAGDDGVAAGADGDSFGREEQVPVFGAGTCSERGLGKYVEANWTRILEFRENGEHSVFAVETAKNHGALVPRPESQARCRYEKEVRVDL